MALELTDLHRALKSVQEHIAAEGSLQQQAQVVADAIKTLEDMQEGMQTGWATRAAKMHNSGQSDGPTAQEVFRRAQIEAVTWYVDEVNGQVEAYLARLKAHGVEQV